MILHSLHWVQQNAMDKSNYIVDYLNEDLQLDLAPASSYELMKEKLAQLFDDWVDKDFGRMLNWLYRIDVSEEKIKRSLYSDPQKNAGMIFAELVLERLQEKENARKNTAAPSQDIPDNERF